MAEVRSPFNFVPLNVRIYSPSWAKLINQDIPFENGISGSLKMTIKAETPIFIRNGHTSEDKEAENKRYCSFSKLPDGKFFIPGSSVKGEVRSVLEILSMGKTHVDPHAMFAWPRLDPQSDVDLNKISCGWLFRNSNGEYRISVCKGKAKRIALWEIDRILGTSKLEKHFSADMKPKFNINKETELNKIKYDPKTAVFKYALLNQLDSDEDLCNLTFRYDAKDNCTYDPYGNFQGTIVLTGQPSQRTNWAGKRKGIKAKGKWKDFVFPTEIDHELKVNEDKYKEYQSLYKNSPDWVFRMKSIDHGVPVFLREDKNELLDFGLTYMYKIPYTHTPKNLTDRISSRNENEDFLPDLAECIFGYTVENGSLRKNTEKQKESLRGRVQFSHFVSQQAEEDATCCLVLNGPKASYVPLYIRQDNGKGGFTNKYLNYNDGQLAGRKRYILRDSIWQKKADGDNVNTTIHPLKAGCSFEGTVHFHNLLPEELGALLSALTFHGNSQCYHQLGQAKPYGFGKVSFTLSELKVPSYMETALHEKDYYMALFEKGMCEFEPSWRYLPSLKELFTLSSMSVRGEDRKFQYMEMSMERTENEFNNVKNENVYLQDFSKRIGKSVLPESCLERYKDQLDKIQAEKEERKAEEERLAKERQAEEERQRAAAERQRAADEIAARKAQRSAAGLTLDELKADGVGYKVVSFKQALNKINRWMEASHVDVLPEKQCDELWITLQRLYAQPDKKEKKEWRDNTSKLWTKITELTSEEQAKAWFDALNN